MRKMYQEWAAWWPLLSAPADYAEEAGFFLSLMVEATANPDAALLELGSGGGNNASHMKGSFRSVTLVDLSQEMLAVSRQLNPDCEHLPGDMRTVRLGRQFDVVFLHDAVCYMASRTDLEQAAATAYVHCKAGGMALFVPDHVRENFVPSTEHGGEDGDGRALRYLEWAIDPDPSDNSIVVDYVLMLREADDSVQVVHERHTLGLFSRAEWLETLQNAGFSVDIVEDPYERLVFVARRA